MATDDKIVLEIPRELVVLRAKTVTLGVEVTLNAPSLVKRVTYICEKQNVYLVSTSAGAKIYEARVDNNAPAFFSRGVPDANLFFSYSGVTIPNLGLVRMPSGVEGPVTVVFPGLYSKETVKSYLKESQRVLKDFYTNFMLLFEGTIKLTASDVEQSPSTGLVAPVEYAPTGERAL